MVSRFQNDTPMSRQYIDCILDTQSAYMLADDPTKYSV